MTHLLNGTVATDLDNDNDNDNDNDSDSDSDNRNLLDQGYTVRHTEIYHEVDQSCIVWNAPALCETDLPY